MSDKPDWWPAGVSESKVRECNCPHCHDMIEALDQWRQGRTPDGEHKRIEAFAE